MADDLTDLQADLFRNAILRFTNPSRAMGVLCCSCLTHVAYSRWMVVVVDMAIEELRKLGGEKVLRERLLIIKYIYTSISLPDIVQPPSITPGLGVLLLLCRPRSPRPINLPRKTQPAPLRRSRNQKLHPVLYMRSGIPPYNPILTIEIQYKVKV